MKEQLDIEINILNEAALKDLVNDIKKGLGDVGDSSKGDQKTTDAIEKKTEAQKDSSDEQEEKIRNDKRETRGLEHLLRRYRWAQSLFLVTQNFMGRMGESISVFGAGMNMLFAPIKLLFNVLLLPFIPIIKEISTFFLDLVVSFSKTWLAGGKLTTALSGVFWSLALFIQALPIAALFDMVITGVVDFAKGLLGLTDETAGAAEGTESFFSKLGKFAKSVFGWLVDNVPKVLGFIWEEGKKIVSWLIDKAPTIKGIFETIYGILVDKVYPIIKKGVAWFIDNFPSIKIELIKVYDYISGTIWPLLRDEIIPQGKKFINWLIDSDVAGWFGGIVTKMGTLSGVVSAFIATNKWWLEPLLKLGTKGLSVAGAILGLAEPVGGDDENWSFNDTAADPYGGYLSGMSSASTQSTLSNQNNTFNITMYSNATNSDQLYDDFVSRLEQNGIMRGAY